MKIAPIKYVEADFVDNDVFKSLSDGAFSPEFAVSDVSCDGKIKIVSAPNKLMNVNLSQ